MDVSVKGQTVVETGTTWVTTDACEDRAGQLVTLSGQWKTV